MVYNFDIIGLFDMEVTRKDLDQQLEDLSYLKEVNEDLIWQAYGDVAYETLAEVNAQNVQSETFQLMNRIGARYLQSMKKGPSEVTKEMFD